MLTGGRCRCRWSELWWCSRLWARLLAEGWVAASPAHGRGECRWCGLLGCSRLWLCSMAADWVSSWPWLVSMVWAFRVFEVVVMFDGRGLGRCAGRRCGRWCVPQTCSMTWAWLLAEDWVMVRVALVVAPLDFKRVRQCSMSWMCSVAVDWVVKLAVAGVDGAGHLCVRACSRVWVGVLAVVSVAWLLACGRLLRVQGRGRA